jgi:hypothetical protein
MALHAIGMRNYKKGRGDEVPHAHVRFNARQAATVSAPSQIALYATGSPALTSQWPGTQTQVAFNGAHVAFVVAPAQTGLYMGGSPSISAHFPDSGGSHPPGQAPHVRKSALYEHAWVWSSFRLDSTELPLAWHLKVIVTSCCPDAVWRDGDIIATSSPALSALPKQRRHRHIYHAPPCIVGVWTGGARGCDGIHHSCV